MNSDSEGTPSYGAEQAELSPIDQIKGYGTSHGVTGSELEEPNIDEKETGEMTPNVTGDFYFTPQAAASNAAPDGDLNYTQQAATMAAASESIHPADDTKDAEDSSFGGLTQNQLLQQLNKLEAESNNLRNELRNVKDNQGEARIVYKCFYCGSRSRESKIRIP